MAENKFDASEEVPELQYDFTNYPGGTAGIIAEPSYEMIRQFRRDIAGVYKSLESTIDAPPENPSIVEQLQYVSNALEKDDTEVQGLILQAVSRLTGIDNIVLVNLPYRTQQAFLGWITGAFLAQGSMTRGLLS